MTQQLSHRQIAWRVAQDLPRGARVMLGTGMPLLVPEHVASESGIVFERESPAGGALAHGNPRDAQGFDHCVLGAREVSQDGDVGDAGAQQSLSQASDLARTRAADARHVFVMAAYFAPDGRPTLVPQCSMPIACRRCATRVYTDLAVLDLHDGKVWLREIIEGITLHVLQAETDVQLHVAHDLRLLHAPDVR